MKERHKEIVRDAIKIINNEVKQRKNTNYIKDCIYYMLLDSGIGISDVDHFDRYYFQVLTGERISSYIKNLRLKFAIEMYEGNTSQSIRQIDTYYDVSRFKKKYQMMKEGKKMKKYVITDMYRVEEEDLLYLSNIEENDDVLVVDASSKEEAIEKYLYTKSEFVEKGILKDMLFRDLWISIGYGEFDYVENFTNSETLLCFADKIYDKYFEHQNKDPEELYLIYDTNEMASEYWGYLMPEDIKKAYYICNRYEVFCLELKSLAEFKRKERNNQKNIIRDMEKEDESILNVIAALIRGERKESYVLSREIFASIGFTLDEATELMKHSASKRFRSVVNLTFENGSFVFYSLISVSKVTYDEEEIENIEIYPTELFYRLAEENYNFADRKNKLAIRVITEQLKKEESKEFLE